ncbi:hypothetical protein FQZ97_1270080 [compost metagenome]
MIIIFGHSGGIDAHVFRRHVVYLLPENVFGIPAVKVMPETHFVVFPAWAVSLVWLVAVNTGQLMREKHVG